MKYTYWQYTHKEVSGLDYVRDHYIGEGKGEVLPIELYRGRFIYVITRNLTDYDGYDYIECKIYDLENPNSACIDKKKYFTKMTAKKYWNKCLLVPEIKNYINTRIEMRDF